MWHTGPLNIRNKGLFWQRQDKWAALVRSSGINKCYPHHQEMLEHRFALANICLGTSPVESQRNPPFIPLQCVNHSGSHWWNRNIHHTWLSTRQGDKPMSDFECQQTDCDFYQCVCFFIFCPFFLEQLRFTHRQHEDGSSRSWQTVSTRKAGTTRRTLGLGGLILGVGGGR